MSNADDLGFEAEYVEFGACGASTPTGTRGPVSGEPYYFECTRPMGHTGNHVACYSPDVMHDWSEEDTI